MHHDSTTTTVNGVCEDSYSVPCRLRELGSDAYLTFLALHVMWQRTWSHEFTNEPEVPSVRPADLAPLAMISVPRVRRALTILAEHGYGLEPVGCTWRDGVWRLYVPAS